MRQINFKDYTQYYFWGEVDYSTNKVAMLERDKLAMELKSDGVTYVCRSRVGKRITRSKDKSIETSLGIVYYINVYSN